MYEQFYVDGSGATVPEVFRQVDKIMDSKLRKIEIAKAPHEVPMPRIHGCPGAIGPLYVTEANYVAQKQKKMVRRAKEKRELELEMIQLLALRDRLRYKLGQFDPTKKSDSKKIAAYNDRLRRIDIDLQMCQEQSGIHIDKLDHGTKIGRFVGRLKRVVKKTVKKIKKFYKRNAELINGVASIALPVIVGILLKGFFRI